MVNLAKRLVGEHAVVPPNTHNVYTAGNLPALWERARTHTHTHTHTHIHTRARTHTYTPKRDIIVRSLGAEVRRNYITGLRPPTLVA